MDDDNVVVVETGCLEGVADDEGKEDEEEETEEAEAEEATIEQSAADDDALNVIG